MRKEQGRNDLCWCKSGKKYKACHYAFDEKIKEYKSKGCIVPSHRLIKSAAQIEGIRESGKVNIAILDDISRRIQVGMSTGEIDRMVCEKTKELGGIPATLGYEGFPKSVCTSINQEVCHGIPSDKVVLQDGDIINIDVTTIVNGYYSDSSRMVCLGHVSEERRRLVDTTREAVEIGLGQAKAWGFLGDIGQAINDFASSRGYCVVREIGGHGVGLEFHEEPFVSYVSSKGTGMLMAPGMIFTIEPMINMGLADVVIDRKNGWTISTRDGRDSAQWEVTVLITDHGYKILAY